MNFVKFVKLNVAALAACLMLSSPADAARVYLDITSPDFRKVPFAVPYFVDKSRPGRVTKADRDMAKLLTRALELETTAVDELKKAVAVVN